MKDQTPFAGIRRAATEIFREHGAVSPVLLIPAKDTLAALSLAPIMDDKDALAALIRDARLTCPLIYFVTEAWISQAKSREDAISGPPPSQRPDRIEVVMVTAYEGVNIAIAYAPINRPEGKPPFLSPWEVMADGSLEGRLALPLQHEN